MRTIHALVIFGAAACAGCDVSTPAPKPAPPAAPPVAQQPQAAPAGENTGGTAAAAIQPEVEREAAATAVKPKGRDYEEGIITTPIKAYFAVPQRITFELQLPEAMKLYKAGHDGPPKNQQEFDQFLDESAVNLPPLPPGSRYVYDPQIAKQTESGIDYLLVEHQKK
jgi:hypothetical protein